MCRGGCALSTVSSQTAEHPLGEHGSTSPGQVLTVDWCHSCVLILCLPLRQTTARELRWILNTGPGPEGRQFVDLVVFLLPILMSWHNIIKA